MDANSTPQGPEFNDVMCNLLFKTKTSGFSPSLGRKKTVVKYTKLPDYDFNSAIDWPHPNSYVLPAKFRKIIALDDQALTACSLNSELESPMKFISTKHTTRKTVTITGENASREHTSREAKRLTSTRYSHRAVGSDTDKLSPSRSSLQSNKKLERVSPKSASWSNKDVVPKNNRSRFSNNNQPSQESNKYRIICNKEKQNLPNRNQNVSPKFSVNKKVMPSKLNDQDICHINRKLTETIFRSELASKKNYYRPKSSILSGRSSIINEIVKADKTVAIHVPTETSSYTKRSFKSPSQISESPVQITESPAQISESPVRITESPAQISESPVRITESPALSESPARITESPAQITESQKSESDSVPRKEASTKEQIVQTYPEPNKINRVTETQTLEVAITQSEIKQLNEEISGLKTILFDCLNTPNITLTKDRKIVPKRTLVAIENEQCLPALESPPVTNKKNENEVSTLQEDLVLIENKKSSEDGSAESNLKTSSSLIISRRTLTYTTKQEINYDVVDNLNKTSHLITPKIIEYPLNVMTVYGTDDIRRLRQIPATATEESQTNEEVIHIGCVSPENHRELVKCTLPCDTGKLIKPSQIISTIRVNTGLLQNDFICEQFERELNFIDSFFESLQYLENCSLADTCLNEGNVENWVKNSGLDNPEYGSLFANLENGGPVDSETMASKSLCLLNLLIRDEQRRAKNLLFVLKMREDALKDFTKSQILWLENKKKLENTDASTLKKKQRGALLKLQHECGEMQRMRKALLALSEKRKGALMKTKNNIELKLKNNVTVEQILLGKKKLKRNTTTDRNIAPLKCFDLSSSGYDEITPPRTKSDTQLFFLERTTIPIKIAEKCVQTGDSLLGATFVDSATDTAAENFVTVDGTYLNILFNNLSLPQIFSAGKQYEVNEEALKNIVHTNVQVKSSSESDAIDKLMDNIKSKEQESTTSTPSTARSLVEELDQYYKDLAEEGKLPLLEQEENSTLGMCEEKLYIESEESEVSKSRNSSQISVEIDVEDKEKMRDQNVMIDSHELDVVREEMVAFELEPETVSVVTGPLPVPAGASATADTPPPNPILPVILVASSGSMTTMTSQESQSSDLSPVSSMTSPALNEAEELRRQQLAIEREIKALEQQQCQLLAVREIPDKPPPPYTPPADLRKPKPSRLFQIDNTIDDKVHNRLCNNIAVVIEPNDVFDVFLQDFCDESINKHKLEHADKPWDACNFLPQKTPMDATQEKSAVRATAEVKELLSGLTATAVTGVGARRSDHIDDILFTEWRRCESEWTALHNDEAAVKNQIFEDIFQRILTETIDEYKKAVHRIIHIQEDET